jgi:hypothetical protein
MSCPDEKGSSKGGSERKQGGSEGGQQGEEEKGARTDGALTMHASRNCSARRPRLQRHRGTPDRQAGCEAAAAPSRPAPLRRLAIACRPAAAAGVSTACARGGPLAGVGAAPAQLWRGSRVQSRASRRGPLSASSGRSPRSAHAGARPRRFPGGARGGSGGGGCGRARARVRANEPAGCLPGPHGAGGPSSGRRGAGRRGPERAVRSGPRTFANAGQSTSSSAATWASSTLTISSTSAWRSSDVRPGARYLLYRPWLGAGGEGMGGKGAEAWSVQME